MTIAAAITFLTSLFKAIPTLDKWFEQLVAAYVSQKKIWIENANKKAIESALKNKDQRGLEHESTSGQYSGVGTIRDTLPGVKND